MKRTSLRNRKANVPTLNSKRLDGISEKSGGLLKTALDCSGQIIFITDPNGVFQYVNPEFMKTYGYEPSEVVGKVTPDIDLAIDPRSVLRTAGTALVVGVMGALVPLRRVWSIDPATVFRRPT